MSFLSLKTQKIGFLLMLIAIIISKNAFSQNDNPCDKSWSEWKTVWSNTSGKVEYQLQFFSNGKCSCGFAYKFVRIRHTLPQRTQVDIWLEGKDCEDKFMTSSFGAEIMNGEISNDKGDWHSFKSISGVEKVLIEYMDGEKKIKIITTSSGTKTYINSIPEEEYNKQQQQKASSSSGNPTNRSGSNKVVPGTAMPAIVFSGDESTNSISNNKKTNQSTSSSSGNQKQTQLAEQQRQQHEEAKKKQQEAERRQGIIHKNTALDDLQRSQQTGQNSIVQQMHLSNAYLMAQASGDAETIRQVQQLQAQATVRNQQVLKESISGLAESTANLVSVIQANKEKKEAERRKASIEYEQMLINEARKIVEVEQKSAPQKKRSIELLQQGMEEASNAYGIANANADKLLNALSWLWKFYESEKILNSKPEVKADYYNINNVKVLSEGYINASELSLMSASRINDILGLDDLNEIKVITTTPPKLLYPIHLPSKARENHRKERDFGMVSHRDVSPDEYIDRRYISLTTVDYISIVSMYKELTAGSKTTDIGLWFISNFMDNYGRDSITCVRDGVHKYRYWNGKSSRSIYRAGFTPQKKLETALIEGRFNLDSAIFNKRSDALPRAIDIYQKTFDWYFSGPVRWLKPETQPANLIREAMWSYALAVAAARYNLSSSNKDAELKEAQTNTFIKHFEQYCQQDISRVTKPMNLKE